MVEFWLWVHSRCNAASMAERGQEKVDGWAGHLTVTGHYPTLAGPFACPESNKKCMFGSCIKWVQHRKNDSARQSLSCLHMYSLVFKVVLKYYSSWNMFPPLCVLHVSERAESMLEPSWALCLHSCAQCSPQSSSCGFSQTSHLHSKTCLSSFFLLFNFHIFDDFYLTAGKWI